jgi:hypothetical protein
MDLAQLAQGTTPLPLGKDRRRILAAFDEAFELIGGVPRLAAWANEHPTEFFKIMSRLATVNVQIQNNTVNIIHSLPPVKALDGDVQQNG